MIQLRGAGGVFLLLLTGIVLAGCASKDEDKVIRDLVQKGATLAEEQDITGLMNLTTEDLRVLPGDLGRQETKRILFVAFRHYQDFKIIYPRPSVELNQDKRFASAAFPFLIVKKDTTLPKLKEFYEDPQRWLEAVGEKADLYRLRLEWVKQDGEWLVKQARLERFTGTSFAE